MKKKIYKSTKKDLNTFVNAVNTTLSFFGISEYETTVYHRKISDARATCQADMENMMCAIEFNTEWNYRPKVKEIQRVAFHEVCELLLYPISSLAARSNSEEETNHETHRIIRRLENVVFPLLFK